MKSNKIYDPNAGQRSNLINNPPQGLGPPSTSSELGSANYNNGNYNFNSATGAQDQQTAQLARSAYQNQLGIVANPQEGEQNAVNTYAAFMRPSFQRQQQIGFGQAEAGLGNRYSGTYGQLTLHDKANQDAIANANNEMNIYNAGQNWYNQQVQNANQLGTGWQTAQKSYLAPYQEIGNQLTGALNSIGQYNNYLENIYGTQMGGADKVAFNRTSYNPIEPLTSGAAPLI